jgi:membrane protein YqaA with SNARE-associated domain
MPLAERIRAIGPWLVAEMGLGGLFLVAFLDSSFLSLPEINDLLVATLAHQDPGRRWLYAMAASSGSLAGCTVLHALGRRGGEPLLRRRLGAERMDRIESRFHRFDILAVAIPSLLPPPCPFKVFVLASGVFAMSWPRFLGAVLAGRSARYLGIAWLASRHGDAILGLLQRRLAELAPGVVLAVLLLWLGRCLLGRRRAERPAGPA